MSETKDPSDNTTDIFSFDILTDVDLSEIDWQKEIRFVGALSGSVIGSFVSTQLSWSLALRIATVVGSSYTGAVLATAGYQLLMQMAEEAEEQG